MARRRRTTRHHTTHHRTGRRGARLITIIHTTERTADLIAGERAETGDDLMWEGLTISEVGKLIESGSPTYTFMGLQKRYREIAGFSFVAGHITRSTQGATAIIVGGAGGK